MLHVLSELNINYIRQYTIKDCILKKRLRFDAFDVDNNVAFEFNGEQHYRPVDFAGKGHRWASHQYQITKQRDCAKYNFCKSNNIFLIIIPHWEKDNMKEYILEMLKGRMII